MEIDKFVHLNKLYSIYRSLLTQKQNQILGYYLDEDLSLGEISQEMGISRQGVHDAIKRSEQILLEYESKLGMLNREEYITQKMKEIVDKLSPELSAVTDQSIEDVIGICKELME